MLLSCSEAKGRMKVQRKEEEIRKAKRDKILMTAEKWKRSPIEKCVP